MPQVCVQELGALVRADAEVRTSPGAQVSPSLKFLETVFLNLSQLFDNVTKIT